MRVAEHVVQLDDFATVFIESTQGTLEPQDVEAIPTRRSRGLGQFVDRHEGPPAPDLATFARAILDNAAKVARGMPGNRKAFVSHVYGAIGATANRWGLDEGRFKALLAEAHRAGLIALTNADLRDRSTMADIQASAVTHQNTVWHLIRVEDV